MSTFETIKTCRDIKPADVRKLVTATRDGASIRDLLDRLEAVSRPHDGAHIVIFLLAGMAQHAAWLPGMLEISLRAEQHRTQIELWITSGTVRERYWRPFGFNAPIEEFALTAQRLASHLNSPYDVAFIHRHDRITGILLEMRIPVREPSIPPEMQKTRDRFMRMQDPSNTVSDHASQTPPSSVSPSVKVDTSDVDDGW